MCICTSIISMCKYLNRTLMTCRFNYPQLVDGSLISPHEGPGPGVLPTSGGLSCGTGVFDGHVGTTSRCATGHGGGGMVEIQSTLRACEVWWSLFGTVWNHCSDECESLCPYPKNAFSCVASHGNRFEMVPNVFASFGATCWFCKFAQCSRLLSDGCRWMWRLLICRRSLLLLPLLGSCSFVFLRENSATAWLFNLLPPGPDQFQAESGSTQGGRGKGVSLRKS